MLADPGRVHAELFGVERLGGDVGDELVRGTGIVVVMIVAEREITEIHGFLLVLLESGERPRFFPVGSITVATAIIEFASVVNALGVGLICC